MRPVAQPRLYWGYVPHGSVLYHWNRLERGQLSSVSERDELPSGILHDGLPVRDYASRLRVVPRAVLARGQSDAFEHQNVGTDPDPRQHAALRPSRNATWLPDVHAGVRRESRL